MRINTNIPALRTVRMISDLQRSMAQSLRRLSSGKRITEARDDAAGLAIGERLKAQVSGLRQAALSINQAFGYLNTADGILATQAELIQRMKELAIQGANGTLSLSDRSHLNTELQELLEEFNRVAEQASYNGTQLLDGSLESIKLQVGTGKGQEIEFSLADSRGAAVFTEISTIGTGVFEQSSTTIASHTVLNSRKINLSNDGDEDLLIANASTFSFLENDGSGSFSIVQTINISNGVMNYRIADINSDGREDLVVQDFNFAFSSYLQMASGNFAFSASFAGQGIDSPTFELVDMNGDGNLDIAEKEAASLPPAIAIHLGNGAGDFTASTQGLVGAAAPGRNEDSFLADLNNDGVLDMYSNAATSAYYYRLGLSDGTFGNRITVAQIGYNFSDPVDINGDGYLDFVGNLNVGGTVIIRLGSESGLYTTGQTQTLAAGFDTLWTPQDIDGDGDLDLLVSQSAGSSIAVRLNNGSGSFSVAQTLTSISGSLKVTALDFNGDGNTDILSEVDGIVGLHLGSINGQFQSVINSTIDVAGGYLDYRDVNNDGRVDIVQSEEYALSAAPLFHLLNEDGTFTSSPSSIVNSGGFAAQAYLDANGDGSLDFVAGSSGSTSIRFYLQDVEVTEESTSIEMQSQNDAQNLLSVLDRAIQKISERRAAVGAFNTRLVSASDSALLTAENLSQAYSQIMDLDMASETAELARLQVLQQAQMAVLGQSNVSLQVVLALLR